MYLKLSDYTFYEHKKSFMKNYQDVVKKVDNPKTKPYIATLIKCCDIIKKHPENVVF